MKELPCIVCDKPMESVYSEALDDITNTPYAGTVFDSHGGYGSTLFDPMDGERQALEITVCDECLVKKYRSVYYRIMVANEKKKYRYEFSPFRQEIPEGGE